MRKARVLINCNEAGALTESDGLFCFQYLPDYQGESISLTMPVRREPYCYNTFPPFFDGLLPEGIQLDGLLRSNKIDKQDYFSQLFAVGGDLVGAITILPANE
jgi:serine/threonine-protein kinase HipA